MEKENPQLPVVSVDPLPGNKYGSISDKSKEITDQTDDKAQKSAIWPSVVGLVVVGILLLGLLAALIALIVISTNGSVTHTKDNNIADNLKHLPDGYLQELARIDCYPESEGGVDLATPESCANRGCIYQSSATPRVPWCFVPQNDFGFRVTDGPIQTPLGERWLLTSKNQLGIYDVNFENVVFDVEFRDNNMLRFKFETPDDPSRYHVPWLPTMPEERASDPSYQLEVYQQDPFSFRVVRVATGAVIWDTGVGGLVFADKFLQIATALPSTNVYGFGENVHETFQHDVDFRSWPIWARDDPPHTESGRDRNAYSSYPFYECVEDDGQAHGVLLWNFNALDYTFTPNPMLVYKTVGGLLDFYVFMGPTPENVIQQYTGAVGRPMIPPYWSLGFQLSRYGYKNTSDMRNALERTQSYGIPIDLQYADIDYMDRQRSFTLDHENFTDLPQYMLDLRSQGMRSVLIVNPTVEIAEDYDYYLRGRDADIFTVFESKEVMPPGDYDLYNRTDVMGTVWPEWIVTFVDYWKSATQDFWTAEMVALNELIPFDGIWLDMNEPGNFDTNKDKAWNWPDDRFPYYTLKCPVTEWDDPPYRTKASYMYDDSSIQLLERLSYKTLCMQNVHGDSQEYRHYDVHSLYGHQQIVTTYNSLASVHPGKRPMIISRSMVSGDAAYGGRWLGDNSAKWVDLHHSIIGMLESNLFGVPYIGADICGFFLNSTPELCMRWHQLGAFYPYSRNHNHIDSEDPGFFGDSVGIPTRQIMWERYRLLPYLYSLFYRAYVDGGTVARPLAHEFPNDASALAVDRQFLWGPALLISPILEEGASVLSFYLPSGRWYDYWDGSVTTETGAVTIDTDVTLTSPPSLHIRGGYIIPTQEPDITTSASRIKPFGLKVALDELDGSASGELFWDDGDTLDTVGQGLYQLVAFTSASNLLAMTVVNQFAPASLEMGSVEVYGVSTVTSVLINNSVYNDFSYDAVRQVLTVFGFSLPMDTDFSIEWS